jgi:hypothetical protein
MHGTAGHLLSIEERARALLHRITAFVRDSRICHKAA